MSDRGSVLAYSTGDGNCVIVRSEPKLRAKKAKRVTGLPPGNSNDRRRIRRQIARQSTAVLTQATGNWPLAA
jgi:hypothetical protein